ncbi:MAG: cryptochrome/photolyase family protein [Akkermansiaceae bacterium]|nr:cryptochrome/photolyase family protein [Akkermansiaceae bacterium]
MEVTLIYPNQLFGSHPAVEKGRRVYLVEEPLLFGNDERYPRAMHQQKLVLHRASMRAYARELEGRGHEVKFIESPVKQSNSIQVLEGLPKSVKAIHLADPVDELLLKRIKQFAGRRDIDLHCSPSPNFLSPDSILQEHIADRDRPFMASFYKDQRKRMGLLIEDDGQPEGGQWSFDEDNRKKLPKGHTPPEEPKQSPNDDVKEAMAWVEKHFADRPGSTDHFRWPVTRNAASRWLDQFFEERFENFGPYEDAISTEHRTIYHAAITPMLNIGLLDPEDLLKRAMEYKDQVPINSLEGFVRQIIGWREFMCGIYRFRGEEVREGNHWNFRRTLPDSFYDASTGIPPVDRVIKQLLDDGYCHHIERLMILGNFMLLCRIKPDEVYRWFMELFVDSYDWVMVPNVYGMSQFADGGIFTTKPYLSGSNYIRKMSDEKKGDWCEVWDGLYWSFIGDHLDFFSSNHRLSMMARSWDKMDASKKKAHRNAAEGFLKRLG